MEISCVIDSILVITCLFEVIKCTSEKAQGFPPNINELLLHLFFILTWCCVLFYCSSLEQNERRADVDAPQESATDHESKREEGERELSLWHERSWNAHGLVSLLWHPSAVNFIHHRWFGVRDIFSAHNLGQRDVEEMLIKAGEPKEQWQWLSAACFWNLQKSRLERECAGG